MKVILRSVIIILYFSSLFFFLHTTTFAQAPEIQWTKTFGDSLDDRGYSVRQTSDGGYIVVGFKGSYHDGLSDLWLIKTDENGDTLWTETLGNSGCVRDEGYSIQLTSDEGYIITGVTQMKCGVNGSWGSGKVWLIKTDENGDSLWSKTYSKRWNSWGNFVQQTTDGGYIVTGITGTRVGGETPIFAILQN